MHFALRCWRSRKQGWCWLRAVVLFLARSSRRRRSHPQTLFETDLARGRPPSFQIMWLVRPGRRGPGVRRPETSVRATSTPEARGRPEAMNTSQEAERATSIKPWPDWGDPISSPPGGVTQPEGCPGSMRPDLVRGDLIRGDPRSRPRATSLEALLTRDRAWLARAS